MNSKLRIMCCLTIIGLLFLNGCNEKPATPEYVVIQELNYLADNTTQSAKQKSALKNLVPADEKNEQTDKEVAEIFYFFFKNFAHEITDSKIDEDKAVVDVRLTTIDATALAKDFLSQSIAKQIQGSANPSNVTYSFGDYYHSLYTLLSAKEYPTAESTCQIRLTKVDEDWQIDPGQNLEDKLTGGFMAAVSNPNLFTPEEIATIYLGTIKAFDKEQMCQFLSLDSLFPANAGAKHAISDALTDQIMKCFDYKIINSKVNGAEATVEADITSYDANSIIQNLSDQMATYTATAQALADGEGGRATKANSILLDCINQNTATTTNKVTLNLINDGIIWKLNMDETLTRAILGSVATATDSEQETE